MKNRVSSANNSLWPSFIDVMSNLVILMIFMVIIFMMLNFVSSVSNNTSKDEKIAELYNIINEKDRVNKLLVNNIKSVKKLNENQENDLEMLYKTLDFKLDEKKKTEIKNQQLQNKVAELNMMILQLEGDIIKKDYKLKSLENNNANLKTTVSKLTTEMQKLNAVFEATDKYITWQKVQIVELGKKLNRALANKTAELFKVRSTFFESLSKAVMGNKNFVMDGDRFIIPSEVFFASGSAEIGVKGKEQLKQIVTILKSAIKTFPDEMNWILRVDGHTDKEQFKENSFYKSNWELSVARAVAVVNFFINEGIPADRLAATGFGEYHPLYKGENKQKLKQNRRIEFKLTEK